MEIYPDIYISNDFLKEIIYTSIIKRNLYRTNSGWASHTSQSSMGADMADVNNDGS
jgi:hypothetical protein